MENVFFMKCPNCGRVFPANEKLIKYTSGSGKNFVSCPQEYTREQRLINPVLKSVCTGYPEYPKCKVTEAEYKNYIQHNPRHYEEDKKKFPNLYE